MTTQGRRPNPTAHDANAQERAIQALKLRKLGFQYDEIAAQCGYNNKGAAWNAVQRLLARDRHEAIEELRKVEALRLDDLMRPFMLRAMKGEKDAAFLVLRIMDRRAKMLGLDMVATGGLPEAMRREYVNVSPDQILQYDGAPVSPNGRSAHPVLHEGS